MDTYNYPVSACRWQDNSGQQRTGEGTGCTNLCPSTGALAEEGIPKADRAAEGAITTRDFGLSNKTVQFIAADLQFLLGQDYYASASSVLNISSHSLQRTPHQLEKEVILTVPAVSRISSIHC